MVIKKGYTMNWFKSHIEYFYSYKGYSAAGVECFKGQGVCAIANPVNYAELIPEIEKIALPYAQSLNNRVVNIHLLSLNKV